MIASKSITRSRRSNATYKIRLRPGEGLAECRARLEARIGRTGAILVY